MSEDLELKIVSGEIQKNLFLKPSYKKKTKEETKDERIFNDVMSGKSDKPVHDDLRKAFKQLIPHFILLCKQEDYEKYKLFFDHIIEDVNNVVYWPGDEFKKIGVNDINSEEDQPNAILKNYVVPSFYIVGDGENEGVVLAGTRTLNSKLDSISFSTPSIKWSESDYPHLHELRLAVEECQEEVLEYYNGKCAPPRQIEMDFNEEDEGLELSISAGGKVVKTTTKALGKIAKNLSKKASKKDKAALAEEEVAG